MKRFFAAVSKAPKAQKAQKDLLQSTNIVKQEISNFLAEINSPLTELRVKLENIEHETSEYSENTIEKRREASKLKAKISQIDAFNSDFKEKNDILDLILQENEFEMLAEIQKEFENLKETIQSFHLRNLLSEEIDESGCFIEIRQGAGGVESCDWVSMLTRMYERWAESQGFQVSIVSSTRGEIAGLKNSSIRIRGKYAFGWAKYEAGVHRFVRVSPFDSNGKRHTSFVSVQVLPASDNPNDSVVDIQLDPKDLKIEVMRAQGAGGQHVNTTESAVRLTHLPTGIVVFSQNERSQHRNKATAIEQLKSKLYVQELQAKLKERKENHALLSENAWGSQIRSYVLQPYQMIKDCRSGHQTTKVQETLDGDVQPFMHASLLHFNKL